MTVSVDEDETVAETDDEDRPHAAQHDEFPVG